MSDCVLISGTSNPHLAEKISKLASCPLGDIEIARFIDSECRVRINEDVKGKTVFAIQSLSQVADQHLVELCLIGQAAKELGARRLVGVIPWMGYSKQDKAFREGEAVSAQLVAKFIEIAGFDAIITVELHSEKLIPYFHIPVKEYSARKLLASVLDVTDKTQFLVVSPDKGGQGRSDSFAKFVQLPIVHLAKQRDRQTGEVKVVGVDGDVTGKDVIIFDDIINTGATAIKTSEFLKRHGAGKIVFLATHAVLAGDASEKLAGSSIDSVVVTDTIEVPLNKRFDKLQIVSVAPLLADAIGKQIG